MIVIMIVISIILYYSPARFKLRRASLKKLLELTATAVIPPASFATAVKRYKHSVIILYYKIVRRSIEQTDVEILIGIYIRTTPTRKIAV